MMKILSIGNSFSQDAQRWLYKIAEADNVEIMTRNLFIGGCTLETHFNNFVSDAKSYLYEKNGVSENMPNSSIKSAILDEDWDVITFQQQSGRAGRFDTYIPYLPKLVEEVNKLCPNAKLYFHETWEYEIGSQHPDFPFYENNPDIMYGMIYQASHIAADRYGLSLIQSGEAVHAVKKYKEFNIFDGGQSVYRDKFHMHLIYGRMLLGYVWYKKIIGKSPLGNKFVPDGADVHLLEVLQSVADKF